MSITQAIFHNNMISTFPSGARETEPGGKLTRRPGLLFLAHPFPPSIASGAVRTWNTAKYLTQSGWDVTVVTPHPSVWRHVDNPEKTDRDLKKRGIRRISTGHRWRCLMPECLHCWNQRAGWFMGGICRRIARHLGIDKGIGWVTEAERACSTLTPKDVDVILASGSPFASFSLAKRLSDRLGRPYVLDYRDPWTINPHAARPAPPAVVREEARLLADCAAVTIVSPSWASAMDDRFILGPKLHVVTNGFDPEELADIEPYNFGHFAIVYTGTFYPPKRVASPIMVALKHVNTDKEWYFHYYGAHGKHVCEQAERFGVMERVVLHGTVPRADALSAVRGADIAVVITSISGEATREDNGIVTGKIFEALGLKTPILLIAPPESDVAAVTKPTGLARRFTGNDTDGIASFLSDMMNRRAHQPKNLDAYAWMSIAKKLDAVLREVVMSRIRKSSEGAL